ncbi:peptidoglycan-associated lipoprotein Pal [Kaustia mangrovi]|uniref:Peptidoglycan-associated lipoprotein n=1 Tax=Kaustia mangrovi TaxID=2593653 RepID=A0A7S8C8H5_9HYPH|nr:peptidoglycan-associated lipoprotein Pal [Kaustia mangrovi]QPC45368.1 peptidoglycan-associated lipoprotein Pal [Kaustia mangrovi]
MRHIAKLKFAAIVFGMLAVAACSSSDRPDLQQQEAAVPGSERDFVLNVGDRVFFTTDVTTLSDEARETLRRQAAWLKLYPQIKVQVEGHADERGTREYNLALSAQRATNVRNFLVSQGIDASRLSTIAYGKERPVALCDAESCWSQNRRAVTIIMSGAASG